jgi:asparagine synthase (glutamine-hydrolysing)
VPASRKILDGDEKAPLKRVASRYLPDNIVRRAKQELAVPLEHWLANELRDTIHAMLTSESCLERGYFDPDALRAFTSSAHAEDSYALWTLFMFERWHQLHIDRGHRDLTSYRLLDRAS